MAIKTFSSTPPSQYVGLEDHVPNEMKGFAFELIRRLQQNQDKLLSDLINQVIVDPSIIPTQTSGSSSESDYSAVTTENLEDSEIMSLMWGDN
jgi:hypothetical protein